MYLQKKIKYKISM